MLKGPLAKSKSTLALLLDFTFFGRNRKVSTPLISTLMDIESYFKKIHYILAINDLKICQSSLKLQRLKRHICEFFSIFRLLVVALSVLLSLPLFSFGCALSHSSLSILQIFIIKAKHKYPSCKLIQKHILIICALHIRLIILNIFYLLITKYIIKNNFCLLNKIALYY